MSSTNGFSVGTSSGRSRIGWRLAALVVGLLLIAAYVDRATEHGRLVNVNHRAYDQRAYMTFARKMVESDYRYLTDGARSPAYPLLLSSLYDADEPEENLFERGKSLSIWLSVALLGVVGVTLYKNLTSAAAFLLLLITAFTVFVFRAAYVQPELLFFSMYFVAFVLLWRVWAEPAWPTAAAVGATLGVAHLAKPSALLTLLLAVFWMVVGSIGSTTGRRFLLGAAVIATAFLAVVLPFELANQRVFGRPFYNVNTVFYMWYDSWEEVKQGTRAHGDRKGWPDMPPEDLPSPGRYVREHTPRQIVTRLTDGVRLIVARSVNSYGYAKYAALYTLAALTGVALSFGKAASLARRHWSQVLFLASLFAAQTVLLGWFGPINYGPRLILVLFLPYMFTLSRLLPALLEHRAFVVLDRRVTLVSTFWALVLVLLAVDIVMILTGRILAIPGGA